MPNALRIGLLGPLRLQDTAGRVVPVGGRQLRVLFTLLALNAGRVVPAASMAEQIWPDDLPGKPGNALQTLVSRLRAETLAATLLGCGHAIRGCFNEGSLDAPVARAAAQAVLGEAGFDAAYDRGRALARDDALALAADTVAAAGSSRADGRAAS
jgi:hypothetical protein